MEELGRRQKAKGAILAMCPDCKGTGKVPKTLPFRANPKARGTRVDRMGWRTCTRCNGTGQVGVR
jgi:RecJ-like exonuclease